MTSSGRGMNNSPIDAVDQAEIIKDKLYFVTASAPPSHQHPGYHFFSTDDEFVYCNYNFDFGPLNLALLCRFCDLLNRKIRLSTLASKCLVYYTGIDPCKRTNAAFLIGSFSILYLGRSADEAYLTIAVKSRYPFKPFRDALADPSAYNLTLLDTLHAVAKVFKMRLVDFSNFNVHEYEHYEKIENGDLNWIVPKRFIAFPSPHARTRTDNGYPMHSPSAYLPYFKRSNVTAVIRLNNKLYDSSCFTSAGIAHHDLFFADGGTPNDEIVQQFMCICENAGGAVAVHCKAGLGRTGTLIGCFLMKHFKFTAAEAIAWTRIARPGSILGPQQQFMQEKQVEMWTQGDAYRRQQKGSTSCQQQQENIETKSRQQAKDEVPRRSSARLDSESTTGSTQGDQLNRLKVQRCCQNHAAKDSASRQRSGVERSPDVSISYSSSTSRCEKRLR